MGKVYAQVEVIFQINNGFDKHLYIDAEGADFDEIKQVASDYAKKYKQEHGIRCDGIRLKIGDTTNIFEQAVIDITDF
jgi:hypothetical protein